MINYTFTYAALLHFLLVFVRVTAFITVAPLIGGQNTGVSNTVKIGFSALFTVLLVGVVPQTELQYSSIAGYTVLVLQEVVCGLIIGFAAQICLMVTAIAGQVVDMMAGLSMVTMMDPTSGSQVTISGTIYNQTFLTMMIVSG
ncbi:MAG: flagellar biosynthetic protein FliR, partial [Lachnospiraceae bacterium]|nr:flagellar biosynthetic protein FliR [Lachnospiraceae bacterium]